MDTYKKNKSLLERTHNYKSDMVRLGIPDEFINHGTQDELYSECYFDVRAIKESVYKLTSRKAQVV